MPSSLSGGAEKGIFGVQTPKWEDLGSRGQSCCAPWQSVGGIGAVDPRVHLPIGAVDHRTTWLLSRMVPYGGVRAYYHVCSGRAAVDPKHCNYWGGRAAVDPKHCNYWEALWSQGSGRQGVRTRCG